MDVETWWRVMAAEGHEEQRQRAAEAGRDPES